MSAIAKGLPPSNTLRSQEREPIVPALDFLSKKVQYSVTQLPKVNIPNPRKNCVDHRYVDSFETKDLPTPAAYYSDPEQSRFGIVMEIKRRGDSDKNSHIFSVFARKPDSNDMTYGVCESSDQYKLSHELLIAPYLPMSFETVGALLNNRHGTYTLITKKPPEESGMPSETARGVSKEIGRQKKSENLSDYWENIENCNLL